MHEAQMEHMVKWIVTNMNQGLLKTIILVITASEVSRAGNWSIATALST
jgi:hypothetical protein